jgi:hypothetical protein
MLHQVNVVSAARSNDRRIHRTKADEDAGQADEEFGNSVGVVDNEHPARHPRSHCSNLRDPDR